MTSARGFISYAWNAPNDPSADYEEPVERIVAFLSQPQPTLRASRSAKTRGGRMPVRDRAFLPSGDDIAAFMIFGARCPYVIVVHSDRYWRSPDCMYELVQIDRDLREQPDKSRKLNVIPVRHPSSRITSSRGLEEYLAHWSGSLDIPARIPDPKGLPDSVRATLRAWAEDLSKDLNYDVPWRDPKQQALEEIARRLRGSDD